MVLGAATGGGVAACGSAGGGGVVLVPGSSKSRSCGFPTVLLTWLFVSCACAEAVPPAISRAAAVNRVREIFFIDFESSVGSTGPLFGSGEAVHRFDHRSLRTVQPAG